MVKIDLTEHEIEIICRELKSKLPDNQYYPDYLKHLQDIIEKLEG